MSCARLRHLANNPCSNVGTSPAPVPQKQLVEDAMPVEHLAIVEGPMAGLGENGEAGDVVIRAGKWMRERGMRPSWAAAGAVVGAFAGERLLKGAAIGAGFGSAMSWLCTRTCQAEQPLLVGVVPMGQIEPSGIEQLGQIEPSGIEQLGRVEMTTGNVIGIGAAGLLAAYLLFGRG